MADGWLKQDEITMSEKVKTLKKNEAKRENHTSQKQTSELNKHAFSPTGQILYLHQTIGNQAVQRLFNSGIIQAKLKIGQPNDIYEQEADRVAERVMRMSDNAGISDQLTAISGENRRIQMKPG